MSDDFELKTTTRGGVTTTRAKNGCALHGKKLVGMCFSCFHDERDALRAENAKLKKALLKTADYLDPNKDSWFWPGAHTELRELAQR